MEQNADTRQKLIFSKIAILDVCGWVEEAMDQLVLDAAIRACLSNKRLTTIKERYIKNTYGFQYSKHFEKMMIAVVGYRILEKIEASKAAEINTLDGTLSQLTPLRNHYAHTHFNLNAPYPPGFSSIPTPSVMKTHAISAIQGLSAIEAELIALNH